ncbi:MAG TPA: tetratricopeptide repeat protein [Longilinea sp.]|nr:tetratricopeptide repeat protein [Longilinea sp.]
MNIPEKRRIFYKPKNQLNPYRALFLIVVILGFVFILRDYQQGTVQPLFLPTFTPTRTSNSYALQGETDFETGNLAAAIASYQQAAVVDPNNVSIWYELARIQIYSTTLLTTDTAKYQRFQEAQASINRAIQIAPDDSTAHAVHAFVLDWTASSALVNDSQSLLTQAEQEAVRALQLDNTNSLALAYYAEILIDQQNLTQASQYIKQALQQDPNSMDIHRIDALLLESVGDYSTAIDQYLEAVKISPNLTFLQLAIGANYRQLASQATNDLYKSQLYDKALQYFQQATIINEQLRIDDPVPYISIARTYSQEGEFFAAALNIRQALAYDPTSADVYGQLGIIYFKARNYEGSIPALRCAIYGCTPAESCDVRQCTNANDPEITLQGLPLTSNTVVYYYTYGSELAAMHLPTNGYCKEAMQVLKQVREAFGSDPTITSIVTSGEDICALYGYTETFSPSSSSVVPTPTFTPAPTLTPIPTPTR